MPPLVPTAVPPAFEPIDEAIRTFPDAPRGYTIGLANARGDGFIFLQGGAFKSVRGALRGLRRAGYRARRTSVRGHSGRALRRSDRRALLWPESGAVYLISTNAPRTVSVRQLRQTAASLDELEGVFVARDAEDRNDVELAITRGTVTARVWFSAQCTRDGEPAGPWEGRARVTLLPRQGNTFTFDVAPNLEEGESHWQGTISGTVDANGGTIEIRASTLNEFGDQCDTGALSLPLRPASRE